MPSALDAAKHRVRSFRTRCWWPMNRYRGPMPLREPCGPGGGGFVHECSDGQAHPRWPTASGDPYRGAAESLWVALLSAGQRQCLSAKHRSVVLLMAFTRLIRCFGLARGRWRDCVRDIA